MNGTRECWSDHEKLEVYREAVAFVAWLSAILEGAMRVGEVKDQLDRASTSIPLNIAEGNGKYSLKDRCRFFDIAHGSALECAAGLDLAVSLLPNPNPNLTLHLTPVETPTKIKSKNRLLSEDPSVHLAMNIRQAEITAAVAVCEPLVIEAHQVQDGGVEIVDMHAVLDGVNSEFVGRAVDHAAADSATGHPHGETGAVVVAAALALGSGRASEFAAPQHQCFIEHAA
jgi:four helix bundle protein